MVLLRSLDHDAAGGVRYTASKKPSISKKKIGLVLEREKHELKNSSELLDNL